MKKVFVLFWIMIMFCSTNVHSQVVNFDDLPNNYNLYGSDYAGITWGVSYLAKDIDGIFGTPGRDIYGVFGSRNVNDYSKPHSGDNYVVNAYGVNNLFFTFDDKVSFMGAWFAKTSSSDSTTKIRLHDDQGKYSDWLTLGSSPKYLEADFMGSKTIYVERTATNSYPTLEAKSNWYSMDDVTYAPITQQTGIEISKSLQLALYSKGAAERLPTYLSAATTGAVLCGGTIGAACIPLMAATLGVSIFEGVQIGRILNDPPDPLYSNIFQPRTFSPFTLDSSSGFSQELIDASNIMFLDQVNLASYLEAWRVTLERYSAASAASDNVNMLRQAAVLDGYILETSQLAITAQSSFNEFLYQLEDLTGPVLFTSDQIQTAMNNLALDGFNESVLQMLSSYDLSSSEIEEFRMQLLQSSIPTDSVDFYSIARSSEGGLGEFAVLTRCVGDSCQAVPEPTTMLLLGLGLMGLAGVRRKFNK